MRAKTTVQKTFILIGHPVGHSVSPAIHEAAYEALGLTGCRYVAVDCPARAAVAEQVERIRRGEIAGANVTIPWKRAVLEMVDEAEGSARDTGAANVLRRCARTARVIAHNTDVPALAAELRSGRKRARRAAVIGSGGAALAAVAACRAIGVETITVVARRFDSRVLASAHLVPEAAAFRALGARPVPWPDGEGFSGVWGAAAVNSDLIVQATSAGMKGAGSGDAVRDIVPWEALSEDVFAYDLVYNPPVTPFLEAASAAGVSCSGGLGMLVGQAARALELWLELQAPSEAMRRAAERALFAG